MADPPPCYFLEKIPAELRNRIYELTFGPGDEEIDTGEVSLCKAKSPPKDLIMTCRQIHSEAAKMYKAEYQQYWKHTKFYVCGNEAQKDPETLDTLKEEDLEQVTQLRAKNNCPLGGEFRFMPEYRVWKKDRPRWNNRDLFVLQSCMC